MQPAIKLQSELDFVRHPNCTCWPLNARPFHMLKRGCGSHATFNATFTTSRSFRACARLSPSLLTRATCIVIKTFLSLAILPERRVCWHCIELVLGTFRANHVLTTFSERPCVRPADLNFLPFCVWRGTDFAGDSSTSLPTFEHCTAAQQRVCHTPPSAFNTFHPRMAHLSLHIDFSATAIVHTTTPNTTR